MPQTAEYWRKRAEGAKAEAERMQDPEYKAIMLDIARAYEWMANRESKPDPNAKPSKEDQK